MKKLMIAISDNRTNPTSTVDEYAKSVADLLTHIAEHVVRSGFYGKRTEFSIQKDVAVCINDSAIDLPNFYREVVGMTVRRIEGEKLRARLQKLGVSNMSINALINSGITTMREVRSLTKESTGRIPGLGEKGWQSIQEAVQKTAKKKRCSQ